MTGLELIAMTETLRDEIRRSEERIQTLRSLACSLGHFSAADVKVTVTPDPGRGQRLLDEMIDTERSAASMRKDLDAALEELALLISRLPDSLSAEVLRLRYLEVLPWREIFLQVHLSRSRAFQLHHDALHFLSEREISFQVSA